MSWNDAFAKLQTVTPKFNDYLLKQYREEQVEHFHDFVDTVFSEATRLFGGDLTYLGSDTLTPEQRIQQTVFNGRRKAASFSVQNSELEACVYHFSYLGELCNPTTLCIPYLYNGYMMFNDVKYFIHLPIIERMIYRTRDAVTNRGRNGTFSRNRDGVIFKVLRSTLQFKRAEAITYRAENCNNIFYDLIVTVRAHYGSGRRDNMNNVPILLYLLARSSVHATIRQLGFTDDDIKFIPNIAGEDSEKYLFFKTNHDFYIRANRELMENAIFRRIVASFLIIFNSTKRASIDNVYSNTFYRVLLGRCISKDSTNDALAASHADTHLASLNTYLDDYTRRNLNLIHIDCHNVFELFMVVFSDIDSWIFDYQPNNLFDKRIGGVDVLLSEWVKKINNRFYDKSGQNGKRSIASTRKLNLKLSQINNLLNIDPMSIMSTFYSVPNIHTVNGLYNDNTMLSTDCKKIRHSSSVAGGKKGHSYNNVTTEKEHMFHPSFPSIESILNIPSTNPGVTGDINPYAVIDHNGCFLKHKMPWSRETSKLARYLQC